MTILANLDIARIILEFTRCLADDPSGVTIEESEDDEYRRIVIYCHRRDFGKVIGKNGRVAKAIRVITFQLGARIGVRYRVEFKEK